MVNDYLCPYKSTTNHRNEAEFGGNKSRMSSE
ncbi:hypothetical protein T11_2103 [Trichinella zimbabwensis]|uniref:Uncharacterized protein n=1 Tax=Trichinella zimbabwensis TaxID=268475 RepID=A0A0V1GIG0_9BILA|nr:hypothetical protein T11_2103 [Trichinella zimbabwensis]